jgi:DNA-binding NtrC family response regulator
MIDQRIRLLVTTIVRVVVRGASPQFLAVSFPGTLGEARFLEREHQDESEAAQRRVLVVDDERLIADSVATILNLNGFEAIARYSGAAALESVRQQCPDIIISDVVMPDLNGIEFAKAVRSICPRARIVLFSGNVDTTRMLDDASVEGYLFEILAKPVHPVKLLETLNT